MSRYSFGPPYPQPGAGTQRMTYPHGTAARDIFYGDTKMGTMFYTERAGGEVHVQYISASRENMNVPSALSRFGPPPDGAAGAIGTKGMRELGAQLKSEGVTSVSGERISGTREGAMHADLKNRGTEVKVSLVGGENEIGGKSVGRKVSIGRAGDQPRVPAGSPEGGQFAESE